MSNGVTYFVKGLTFTLTVYTRQGTMALRKINTTVETPA
jgi:hypothetical protein